MSNKRKGTEWEFRFCEMLAERGYWAHRIEPDVRGAQPFDVIAVKDNRAYAFDCKTCEDSTFRIDRVEENQKMAFELWLDCGNDHAYFAVKHDGKVFLVPYSDIYFRKKVKLDASSCWAEDLGTES